MQHTATSPRVRRREADAAAAGPATGPEDRKRRILIVDDSLTVRMDLRRTFESADYEVALCETLAAARAALARQLPALVVLDVLLPDGDGIDLLREIKSMPASDMPVMLLSTEAEVGDRVRGLKTGADDYVGKPYDATYVLARARELIGAAAHSPRPAAGVLLLIDDSATARQQFRAILETAGYCVVTAESGEEGLRTAFALRPDAIIVDRLLPGGIDGDAVIRRLKQDVTLRNTPCLLLTASTGEGDELRMLDAGADAFLGKEADAEVFLARMAALIRSGGPAPAVDASVSSLLGAKKILVVDGNITCLNEVSAELRREGYDVVQALTGNEALELLEVQPVDAILLEVRMAGLSGHEICRMIKQRPAVRGIPLLMLTAGQGPEGFVEAIKAGADDYVLRSGDFTVLKARLRAQLRRKQFEDEAQAEETLRSSEASYRSLIQSAPCGILRLSAIDGRLLDANTALAGMLGYDSPADLLREGAAGGIVLAPDVLSRLTAGRGEGGRVIEAEVLWNRRDGSQLLVGLAGRLLRDRYGDPDCLEMIAENITERRQARQRIEQLNRLYSVLTHANQVIVRTRESVGLFREICRIIVEEGGFQMAWLGLLDPGTGVVTPRASCPQQSWYLDSIRITTTAGPEGCGPVGRAVRENRHVICNDLAGDPSMAPWRERALRHSFRSHAAFPIVIHGRSLGAIGIYSSEVDFFDIENTALLAELAADVSFALERIETERMHRRVAGDLDQFFALSIDMLSIFDLEGYIQRANPAWEKTLGFSAAEIRSRPWVELVHPEDRPRALEALAGFRSGAEVRRLELRFRSKSGNYRWLVASATPALDRGVVYAAASDITDRKQLEERLRNQNLKLEERSRRIEAGSRMKSEFLANMSHELRSPLNGIIGFSELLYDGKLGALPERPREFVGRIHASASHLLQLINDVLDLSKIEAGHLEFRPERLLVSRVVQEVTGILGALAAEKHIQVETEIEAGVDEVTIDAGRFRQVLYNYLSNALKFTGEGGRVVVRVKSEGDAEFRLEVSDTGIGISEENTARLFVDFQQLDASTAKRYQGTGLGLALTKRIVEAQGGRVGVSSAPGEGSTFFAEFPRVPLTAAVRDGGATILVIDDQNLDQCLLTHILQSQGYRVELATTCAEAYEKCRRRRFDAITLDLVLPDGPGWEALARIRSLETHRNTPVVVISSCEPGDTEIPIAVESFLTKPVRPDRLLAELKRFGVPMGIMEAVDG